MKNFVIGFVLSLLVLGLVAWMNRTEFILAAANFMTERSYADIAETQKIVWKKISPAMQSPDGGRLPNIVLIVADDLGYNDISTFGGGVSGMKTPAIDQLAAQGVVFTQSYSGASTCAPSRAMLMTGRYPTRTGFEFTPIPAGMAGLVASMTNEMDNDLPPSIYDEEKEAGQPDYNLQGLPASEVTIAEILQQQGYYTAHIGKWHLGRGNGMAPHEQGFDDILLMYNGLYLPEDDPNVVNAKLPFDPIDRFLWAGTGFAAQYNGGALFKPGGYLTDYWTDESIKVIRANKDRPFFLYLAHWGPHTPLQATRDDYDALSHIEPHRKRVYAGMIRAVDRSVRRILDTLESEGLTDNTLVVFTSDNGGAGYLGIEGVNSPFRGWKITMFEGGLRVPMFMRWPGRIKPGSIVDTPVAHIDLMPTLASAALAPLPNGVVIDGVDVLGLATGDAGQVWNRDTLFWQNGNYQVVRQGDWKLQVNDRPTDGIQYWLFNLANDPTEQTNLAGVSQSKLDVLLGLLAEHRADARPLLFDSSAQVPVMVDKTLVERFEPEDEYVYAAN